jgi:hypothetical protein
MRRHVKDEEAHQLEDYPALTDIANFNVEEDPWAL